MHTHSTVEHHFYGQPWDREKVKFALCNAILDWARMTGEVTLIRSSTVSSCVYILQQVQKVHACRPLIDSY